MYNIQFNKTKEIKGTVDFNQLLRLTFIEAVNQVEWEQVEVIFDKHVF